MKLSYTEKLEINIVEKKVLHDLCFIAKCIYNCSLYQQRQYYKETKKYLSKKKLYETVRDDFPKLYGKLNSWVAQRVIYKIDQDYRSFFERLKNANEKVKIKPPYYKKVGLIPLDFANAALARKGDQLQISLGNYLKNRHNGLKYLLINIPKHIKDKTINHISIIPKGYSNFEVKYTYDVIPSPFYWS